MNLLSLAFPQNPSAVKTVGEIVNQNGWKRADFMEIRA